MTDRAHGLLVHFEGDYRIGDGDVGADALMQAISMIKGVTKVEPIVAGYEVHLARERARMEFQGKMLDVLRDRSG